MGFFDNLKETAKNLGATIKEGADKAADKAKDIAETTKQKAAISEAERKIKDVYTEMGKNLLEQFPDKAKELFPEQIGKIDEFNKVVNVHGRLSLTIRALSLVSLRRFAQNGIAHSSLVSRCKESNALRFVQPRLKVTFHQAL